MNKPIRTMSVLSLVLFLMLLLNVTYLQVVKAGDLNGRNDNDRVRNAEFSRKRGAILVAGDPVAESRPVTDKYKYQRRYPQPFKYAHVVGYYSYLFGRNAVELTQDEVLSGSDPRLFVDRVVDLVNNTQPEGGSVSLTLDPAAQTAAFEGLLRLGQDVQGAVVALEPATGRILAMVSSPTYDPRLLASHDLGQVENSWDRLIGAPSNPLQNRGIQEVYPPGSSFKLVTAAAALSTGDYDPDTLVKGGPRLDLPETTVDLVNENGSSCGGDPISLTQALVVSCNVSFGSIGLDLGDDLIRQQAEAFGFGEQYLDDLNAQAPSRFPQDPNRPNTALSAIGQYDVAATPLQMAMVAAGIANNGQVMKPYVVDEVRAPDLSVLDKTETKVLSRAISSSVAHELTQMMTQVVDRGTGTNAQIPGIKVAGKTGTAQSSATRPPYAWFVSFAPADNPQVAVAVLVETSGTPREEISGNGLAAPIARQVMEAVINQ